MLEAGLNRRHVNVTALLTVGATDFAHKPLPASELLRRVEALIAGHQTPATA